MLKLITKLGQALTGTNLSNGEFSVLQSLVKASGDYPGKPENLETVFNHIGVDIVTFAEAMNTLVNKNMALIYINGQPLGDKVGKTEILLAFRHAAAHAAGGRDAKDVPYSSELNHDFIHVLGQYRLQGIHIKPTSAGWDFVTNRAGTTQLKTETPRRFGPSA